MKNSLSSRAFKIAFTGNLISLIIILAFSWWSLEALEATAIYSDQQIEIEYFEKYGEKNKPQRTHSLQLISVYQPKNNADSTALPIIFQGIEPPFSGEVELLDKKYNVFAHEFPEGTLYMAKDLSHFKEHEATLVSAVLFLFGVLVISNYLLAIFVSRQISTPILDFIMHLRKIQPGSKSGIIKKTFVDDELNEIAQSVNELMARIADNMNREKSLISMASHELRTPVSVILGAASIIDKRNQLQEDDKKTLARIIAASIEMRDNLTAILHLVKKNRLKNTHERVHLKTIISELIENYEIEHPGASHRITLHNQAENLLITGDKALIRMLIHNLLSNALNHSPGGITVELGDKHLDVIDQGSFVSSATDKKQYSPATGLGLYIVYLICEAIDWHYQFMETPAHHTCIRLVFTAAESAQATSSPNTGSP